MSLSLAHQVEGVVGSSGRSALDTGFTLAEADLLQRAQEVEFKVWGEIFFYKFSETVKLTRSEAQKGALSKKLIYSPKEKKYFKDKFSRDTVALRIYPYTTIMYV